MDNSKNSRVFNFAILLKSRKSRKFDAREIYKFYSMKHGRLFLAAGPATTYAVLKTLFYSAE